MLNGKNFCRPLFRPMNFELSLKRSHFFIGVVHLGFQVFHLKLQEGNSLFAAVRIFKNHLSVDFSRGQISPDGQKSKNFFTVDDPKNKLEAKSWTHKSGRVGNSYVMKLSKASDLEYAKYFIKQKYDSL